MKKPKVKVQKGAINPHPFSVEMETFPQKMSVASKDLKKRRKGQIPSKA